MPPRYAYWTILVDGGPTAFRAAEPDELLPTLKRLQVKQPDAIMKWFEKGRLWDSRDEAQQAFKDGYTVGPGRTLVPPTDTPPSRDKGWRPGGQHRDPREKYQLAKKAKWQKFKQNIRERAMRRRGPDDDPFKPFDAEPPVDPIQPPHPDEAESREPSPDAPVHDTPPPAVDWRGRPKPSSRAPSWRDRPKTYGDRGDRPRGPNPEWRNRPGDRPRGPKPAWRDKPAGESRDRGAKAFDRGGDRPRGPKPEWRDRSDGDRPRPKTFDRDGDRPRGPKPEWRDRGPKSFDRGGDRPRGPKPEWRDRPDGDRPRPRQKAFDRDRDRPGGDRPRGPKPPRPRGGDHAPAKGRFRPKGRGPGGPPRRKKP